ncbi:hypothetical protein ACFSC4_25940 [Deinococcus malanensis]|uniref:hypothetical protein n=1 Tax=Deinococcus malanensis TaxID=1706855 RepID=UPI00363CC179
MAKQLNRFLKGQRTEQLPRYVPGQILEASLDTDAPLLNGPEADAALQDLLPGLVTEMRGRTAAYLTIRCETLGGSLTATRKLKWPLDRGGLTRVATLTLEDTGALPLGIDRLTVQLSGLQQPSRMVGLWAGWRTWTSPGTCWGAFRMPSSACAGWTLGVYRRRDVRMGGLADRRSAPDAHDTAACLDAPVPSSARHRRGRRPWTASWRSLKVHVHEGGAAAGRRGGAGRSPHRPELERTGVPGAGGAGLVALGGRWWLGKRHVTAISCRQETLLPSCIAKIHRRAAGGWPGCKTSRAHAAGPARVPVVLQ